MPRTDLDVLVSQLCAWEREPLGEKFPPLDSAAFARVLDRLKAGRCDSSEIQDLRYIIEMIRQSLD